MGGGHKSFDRNYLHAEPAGLTYRGAADGTVIAC